MEEVVLPNLGMVMEEGTIVRWLKQEGDEVAEGDVLLEIETDKAVVEVESPGTGVLRAIIVQEGATVPVSTVIGLVGSGDEAIPDSYTQGAAGEPVQTAAAAPTPAKPAAEPAPRTGRPAAASPAARRLAREHDIDLATVEGTGPGGRIRDADVRSAIEAAAASATAAPTVADAASAEGEIFPLTRIRRTAAVRLTESFRDVPHFYLTVEARADRLRARREALLPSVESETGVRLSFTDLFVDIIARALSQHPRVNASWRDGEVRLLPYVNVAVAMDTEDGLVVPVIHRADTLSIAAIAQRRAELTAQARSKKLSLDSMQGGTFTLTNLGAFGIDSFVPIINPPQAAILGTGSISERPIVVGGMLALCPTVNMTLSSDHRVLDGVAAAKFLQDIKEMIEQA